MTMRAFLFCLLLVPLLPATSHAGARLDAMAGDGLLLADADADHLWPAALADHAPALALRGWLATGEQEDRPREGAGGPDVRLVLGEAGVVRGFWYGHADAGPARADKGVQGAWRFQGLNVGVAWHETTFEREQPGDGRRRSFDLGLRLAPTRALIDLTAAAATYEDDRDQEQFATLRLRIHLQLSEAVTAVAVAEERGGPDWSFEGWGLSGGLLFWPDADLQILVGWREQGQDRRWYGVDGQPLAPDLRFWQDGSRGPHLAAELRPSAWWSWRAGARVQWPREGEARSPGTWLGLGGSLHAGDWDLVAAWSRRESSAAPGLFPSDTADTRLRLDLIRFF
ncbi:MAG TPA: hypothetical protein P5571_03060 [Candidatus Krumholzibacteria bacterium]|nr:hypothetical protein [Candidatus Krumholzibacteria bacterium]HRX50321.1 hypothetical protein [Candidatus Krumholzibacteria bacterium]